MEVYMYHCAMKPVSSDYNYSQLLSIGDPDIIHFSYDMESLYVIKLIVFSLKNWKVSNSSIRWNLNLASTPTGFGVWMMGSKQLNKYALEALLTTTNSVCTAVFCRSMGQSVDH